MMSSGDGDDWMFETERKLREHEERKKHGLKTNPSQPSNEDISSDQSFCVRVPDDDGIFEHDDVYENSPYLEQAKRHRDLRLNALTEEQKKYARVAFTTFLAFSIVVGCYLVYGDTFFPDKDQEYFFEMGFDAEIPSNLNNAYLEWDVKLDMDQTTPVFWNIPLSGGDIVEDIVASCLKLVQANEVGGLVEEGYAKQLEVVQVFGDSYVNVDTTTPTGITHASSLRLAQSGLADVIFTPMVYEPTKLFPTNNQNQDADRGYMFTILRHPVERAVHMFYYLKDATWDPLYRQEIKYMTIEEYAGSPFVESNWMTRILSNHTGGTLTKDHVSVAKEILRRKFLVGIFAESQVSMKKFEKRFGWYAADEETEACEQAVIEDKMSQYNKNPMIEEGSPAWESLLNRNKYDMEIYEFAKMLFLMQKSNQSD